MLGSHEPLRVRLPARDDRIVWLLAQRIVAAVPVVFGVSLVSFIVVDLLPGNVAHSLLGTDASAEQIAQYEAELGLDRPAVDRYFEWLSAVLEGDLGRSLASGQAVNNVIAERAAVTVELAVLSLALSVVLALTTAVLAAHNPGGWADGLCRAISMVGISVPNYVLAIVLVLVFSVNLRLFPSIGFVPLEQGVLRNLQSLVLPAVALGSPFFCVYSRFLRSGLVDQIEGAGYILTAKAKGLGPWRILLRHALPNSLIGMVTLVGLNFGPLLGGTVIVEQIFSLPGIGHLLIQAAHTRDIPVVQAIVLIVAAATVAATLLTDVLHMLIDPRIRYARA